MTTTKTTEPVLPIVQGDWVATLPGRSFRVGRVRQSYVDHDKVYMDLILYNPDGRHIGRESPHMGGPKTFEPWLEYTGNWRRIERPSFPIPMEGYKEPVEGKKGKPQHFILRYDSHRGVKVKAERIVARKQRSRPLPKIILPTRFNVDGEISALRRSAQKLRDMARKLALTDVGKKAMMDRATELEKEAAALAR